MKKEGREEKKRKEEERDEVSMENGCRKKENDGRENNRIKLKVEKK